MDRKNSVFDCVIFLIGTTVWLCITIYMLFHSMPMLTLFSAIAFFFVANGALKIDLDKMKDL